MAEYIAREALKQHALLVRGEYDDSVPFLAVPMPYISGAPAADVRPVVRGRFEYISPGRPRHEGFYQCSACAGTTPQPTKFCPNCGADMREVPDGKE